ncbi:MAG: LAGLIDADG family homing endonuclease [Candidatus Aenigmarchaeota archaeon]|nr:LAGLIDADG family homing endonuclease [Candidatus Aenigmarchaeota archaeon]
MTGVLPVALENATKAMPVLMGLDKEYVGVMHLHKEVPEEILREAISKFIGRIEQLPPVKAAVARRVREREVYFFDILEIEGKDVLFKIGCEAGTYVRKLCLTPETEVILNCSGIKTIQNFVENWGSDEKTPALDLNAHRFKNCKIINFQKVEAPKKLVEIKTESGISIKVTPDHEILVDTLKGPKWIKSAVINPGDLVYSARAIKIPSKLPFIVDLLDDDVLVFDKEVKEICRKMAIQNFGSIRNMNRILKIDRRIFNLKRKIGIRVKYIRQLTNWELIKKKIKKIKTERGFVIELPKFNENLMYLLGILASDGCIVWERRCKRPNRFYFHNKNEKLIDKFLEIHKQLFPNFPIRKKKLRGRDIFQVDSNNIILAGIAYSLGIKSPNKKSDFKLIFTFPEELIKAFLRGYLDGDGGSYVIKKKVKTSTYTDIQIYTSNYLIAKRIYLLFKKLGIRTKIYTKKMKGHSGKASKRFVIDLVSPYDKIKFIKQIGSFHPEKMKAMKEIGKVFKRYIGLFSFDLIPQYTKILIRKVLEKNKIPMSKLKLGASGYRLIHGRSLLRRHTLKKFLKKIRKFIKNSKGFKELEKISNSNYYLERVKKIKIVPSKSKWVYDLTVDKFHNFLANGCVVVSNCHDLGNSLGVGAHLSELRRTKVGNFTEEKSYSLLKVKDAYELWKGGNEKELRKILIPVEHAILHVKRVFVKDSAIHNIASGAPVYVSGICRIQKGIVRGEVVAIYSNKEELVAFGTAKLNSNEMYEKKEGTAIRTHRVFIGKDVYPKM